jgi:hypothetical protein
MNMKNTKLASRLMDITYHKEFETIATRSNAGIPAPLSFERLCLQNAWH